MASSTLSTINAPEETTGKIRKNRMTSEYSGLLQQIKEAGLLRRRHSYYAVKIVGTVAALVATAFAFFLVGNTWFQLIVAGALAVVFTQLAFIGHETAHRQVFRSGRLNDWFGVVLSNLIVGLSYGWWNNKHNRHHGNPNTIGKDPDIVDAVIVFTPEQAQRRHGLARTISGKQGYFFFPLLLLEGINLHKDALRTVFGRKKLSRRWAEMTLLTIRLCGVPAVVFIFLSPGLATAFLGVQLGVFGLYMGSTFAPNHKGMPLIPAGTKVDFLQRQVLTSRNIRSNWFIDWFMGGLNFQVEHHLFPSMPRPNLRAAQRIVREYCLDRDVAYTEVGIFRSWAIVVTYLNRVGLGQRDPFECPMIAQMRPRA
ncbi:fatty acid desaturase family protein [Spelaeicoccus albus]|uniref:Fatty acid desaturase n=1 Tax=Spelaeicoccus albus TaxID=1280376 RepID=A0A7Z0A7I6_9MICO|nr:acyl-CoA desaturase [Spelaeicoccus albus]NYI65864.1 fatty acid desaturase [Spelaeicoccus albus]